MTTAPRSVTIGVRDLEQALDLFHRRMDLDMESMGTVPPDVLSAWGLPEETSARFALLSRGGYPAGRVRLLQVDPPATVRVRHDWGQDAMDSHFDFGPKAMDFYSPGTMDEAIAAVTGLGYPVRNGPVTYAYSGLSETVFEGPGGVPFMLMNRPDGPSGDVRSDLPEGVFGEIATISIIASDLEGTRRFYGEVLNLPKTTDRETPPSFAESVAMLTGVPVGTRVHWMMFVEDNQPSAKLLLIHFIEGGGKPLTGGMQPGHLGICLYSFSRPDVDAVAQRADELGFAVEREPVDTAWGHIALIRGPNGELVEITEA